jgi:site-specific DNA-cytosine methylase
MSVFDELNGMTEIALFAGAGGGVLGSKMLGIRTVAYVEWDAFPQAILKARMADGLLDAAPVFGDVREFDPTPYAGKTDIVSGGFPCFVAGTMVLTRDGYRAIEEIQPGDLVLTHMGRWRPVNSVMFKGNAPLREIHAQGVPGVVCSDNHPFHARASNKVWDKEARTYRRAFSEPVRTAARGVTDKHFLGQVLPPVLDDDKTEPFWGLVGRYLADGCRNFSNNAIIISGSASEADAIRIMVEDAGFSPKVYAVDTGSQVVFHDREFFDFLDPFGRYSHGKHIPGWALQLPTAKAKALLEGYLSGDGHRTDTGWEANTVSKALALSLSILAQRAYGIIASVRLVNKAPTTQILGRTVNQRSYYAVRIPTVNRSAFIEGDYGWKKVRRNDPKGFGDVYNIAVDEDHTYVADGAVVLNCQPFSNAGRQEADFDPRNMWPATRDIIRSVRPKYAYLENVAGLLTGNHGYFGVVLGELASIGYDITWTCLPAAAVGAPHRRDRLWVLGRRRESTPLTSGNDHFVEFARFDTSTLSWVRFGGQCRGATESSVTAHLLFPRSGFVCPDASGTMVVYALDPVALADGKTRGGWPWPRILEDLQISDPNASVKEAPVATSIEMMPTPNAFDAYAVGASRSASRPEWGRHGVSLHHLAAKWSAHEGHTFPTPLAGDATPGEGGNHGGMAPRGAAAQSWPTPNASDWKGSSQPVGRRPVGDDDLPSRVQRGNWPTPSAGMYKQDVNDSGQYAEGIAARGHQITLAAAVKLTDSHTNAPHPVSPPEVNSTSVLALDDLVALGDAPENWALKYPKVSSREGMFPTPCAVDSDCNQVDGVSPLGRFIQNNNKRPPRRSQEERIAARAVRAIQGPVGQLNPDWVEWLMGWPVGWTSMAPMTPEEVQRYAAMMPGSWWSVEPAGLPRITVATPDRASRLKACGNGQVALANAAAFEVLLETFRQIEVAAKHEKSGAVDVLNFLGL